MMGQRTSWFLFLAIVCVGLFSLVLPLQFPAGSKHVLFAQDAQPDELEAAAAAHKDLPSVEEKPSEEDAAEHKRENFLLWLYHSLKVRYVIIFLILSFNAVSLIVMLVLALRRIHFCPDDLLAVFESKLNAEQYQEAYNLVKGDESLLGRVLAAGMAKLSEGYDAALEAMQEVGEAHNMKLEQRNGYVALIAQIGPMFGLLGTVDGMVMAFDAIATKNVTPKPSELAVGIGTALVTTIVGLWLAIPLMVFYHVARNRLTRLVTEVATVSGNLMKRFSTIQISLKLDD